MLQLPKLPYQKDDLEPYISEITVQTHYNKHTKGYFDHANKAIDSDFPQYQNITDINEMIRHIKKSDKGSPLYNNVCQAWNHVFYWDGMTKNSQDQVLTGGPLYNAIRKTFGSLAEFKKQFTAAGEEMFGSGWIWLVLNPDKTIEIITTPDGDTPVVGTNKIPLVCCDVWEHAYYLDEKNEREVYVKSKFFSVVNWTRSNDIYTEHV